MSPPWSQCRGWRQHGALDRYCARHLLTMRAPLDDFLRQAAKRLREVDQLRQWRLQILKQAQVKIVLSERLQRIGVKSDRLIERLKSVAQPASSPRQEIAGSRCRIFAGRRYRCGERVVAFVASIVAVRGTPMKTPISPTSAGADTVERLTLP